MTGRECWVIEKPRDVLEDNKGRVGVAGSSVPAEVPYM